MFRLKITLKNGKEIIVHSPDEKDLGNTIVTITRKESEWFVSGNVENKSDAFFRTDEVVAIEIGQVK